MASEKACPHGPGERVVTSQTWICDSPTKVERLPTEILRPEVAEILRRPDTVLTS
jgi:ATP sulfurylase